MPLIKHKIKSKEFQLPRNLCKQVFCPPCCKKRNQRNFRIAGKKIGQSCIQQSKDIYHHSEKSAQNTVFISHNSLQNDFYPGTKRKYSSNGLMLRYFSRCSDEKQESLGNRSQGVLLRGEQRWRQSPLNLLSRFVCFSGDS